MFICSFVAESFYSVEPCGTQSRVKTADRTADDAYKQALVEAEGGSDIVYTNLFTGVHGNYLRSSIMAAGLDPENLPQSDKSKMNFGSGGNMKQKAWRDIWGAGQGVGQISDAPSVGELVDRLEAEYRTARSAVLAA